MGREHEGDKQRWNKVLLPPVSNTLSLCMIDRVLCMRSSVIANTYRYCYSVASSLLLEALFDVLRGVRLTMGGSWWRGDGVRMEKGERR